MQLSSQQIDLLFSFTQKKGVHWYDLQLELVDHLACRIEEEMEAEKSLSFDAALEKVYKGFGLFGFAKVVQEKAAELDKASRKIWWAEVILFFKWPKIILLLLIAAALWQLSSYITPSFLMRLLVAINMLLSVILLRYEVRTSKMKQKLLILQFGSYFSFVVFLYEVCVLFNMDNFGRIEFTLAATLGILFKWASFRLYKKVKQQAVKLYPEAFA